LLKKTSQEAIAEIMEVSQPTILRAPAVGLRSATGGYPRRQGHYHLRSPGGDRPLLLHCR